MLKVKHSLKKQFYITTIGIVVFIIVVSFSYNMFTAYKYNKKLFIDQANLQTELIADNIVESLLYLDKKSIFGKFLLLGKYKDILQVSLYNKDNELIVMHSISDEIIPMYEAKHEIKYLFLNNEKVVDSVRSKFFIIRHDIYINSINYGHLYLTKSTDELTSFLLNAILDTILFLSILLSVTIIFTIKISNVFIHPIVRLSETIIALSKTNNYSTKLKYNQKNEIGKLYNSFNSLFESIHLQQNNLQKLNNELENRVLIRTRELENSLNQLKKTQNQLIESEKMAALGSLVSGVAHEINTPLGNALTGSTIVHNDSKKLLQLFDNNTLKKSTLNTIVRDIQQTSSLVVGSITKAANLVKSFKQISVDQNIEEIREFNVYDYTQEIILTFQNKLKTVPVKVTLNAKKNIMIKSYPGVFAQILSNFIQNSILHGFETKTNNAEIIVTYYIKDNDLYFIYSDNGVGIDSTIKDTVFEPFVTTKRNSGGTGLGLNILYNLVTQKLKGEIKLQSNIDKGVEFKIVIPL